MFSIYIPIPDRILSDYALQIKWEILEKKPQLVMKYCVVRKLVPEEEEIIHKWRSQYVDDIKSEWINKKLHITILYIGKMELTKEREEELQELINDMNKTSVPLPLGELRTGAWDPPVVLIDVIDKEGQIQHQHHTCYGWCILNKKIPEMTNGQSGTHPGPHLTIALPDTKIQASNFTYMASESYPSLLARLPLPATLSVGPLELIKKA